MREYQNFEIIVQAKDSDGKYPLFARSPVGEASGYMTLSTSDDAEHAKLEKMGQSAEQEAALKAIGRMLFERLFPDPIQQLYQSSRDLQELRLRLIINPPELGWLHWEYLYDERDGSFPATSTQTVLVRHIPMQGKIEPVTVSGPLRILVMIAAPTDLPTLNVAQEKDFMQKELAELVQKGRVELDIAEGTQRTRCTKNGVEHLPYNRRIATVPGLQDLLREGYHAFHFIGHGAFNQHSQTGELALEDEDTGQKSELKADVLRVLFRDASLKLAVLNGCETGMTSAKEPLLGAAPALVKAGIPAVVAMQFRIPDRTAIIFSRTFYGALADGFPVDAAVAESRKAIYAEFPTRRDWGIPVFFMRSPDGVLWEFEQKQKNLEDSKPQHNTINRQEDHTMDVSTQLLRQIIDFFMSIPNINTPKNQYALINYAGLDRQLVNQLSMDSPPAQFFPLLIPALIQYGRLEDNRQALVAVMESSKQFLGKDGKAACDKLIRELGYTPTSPETPAQQSRGTSQQSLTPNYGTSTVINISGNATLTGVALGNNNKIISDVQHAENLVMSDGGDVNITQNTTTNQGMSFNDALKIFQQLKGAVDEVADVASRKAQIQAKAEIDQALVEMEEPEEGEPAKQTIAQHLENATKTLQAAGATALQAVTFGKLAAQAATWLGPYADGLLKLLGL